MPVGLVLRFLRVTFLTKLLGSALLRVPGQLGVVVNFFRGRATPLAHTLLQFHKITVSAQQLHHGMKTKAWSPLASIANVSLVL